MGQKHRRHRGVHSAEITALMLEVGISAPEKDAGVLRKLQRQLENEEWHLMVTKRDDKRWAYLKRHQANKKTYTGHYKQKAKVRKTNWLSKRRLEDTEFKPSRRIRLK
jgi:hypothetical protein